MTRAAWKVLYRLLRICRRESAKAAKDFVIFGIGAVMFDPTLPDCIRHVPIEELQTKYKEYLYGWPSDRIDGNAQGTALMNQSPDLQDLYLALATAQGAIENAAKNPKIRHLQKAQAKENMLISPACGTPTVFHFPQTVSPLFNCPPPKAKR